MAIALTSIEQSTVDESYTKLGSLESTATSYQSLNWNSKKINCCQSGSSLTFTDSQTNIIEALASGSMAKLKISEDKAYDFYRKVGESQDITIYYVEKPGMSFEDFVANLMR